MGGGIVGRLMAMIPDRIITAGFGGSGIQEADPEWRAKAPKDKEGRDPQEDEASRPAANPGAPKIWAFRSKSTRSIGATTGAATRGAPASSEQAPLVPLARSST